MRDRDTVRAVLPADRNQFVLRDPPAAVDDMLADARDRGPYLGAHFQERLTTYQDYYGEYGPDGWREPRVERVREYLASQNVDVDELSIYDDPRVGGVRIDVSGYVEDWDHFMTVMQESRGIRYDRERQTNYVPDIDRLAPPSSGSEV